MLYPNASLGVGSGFDCGNRIVVTFENLLKCWRKGFPDATLACLDLNSAVQLLTSEPFVPSIFVAQVCFASTIRSLGSPSFVALLAFLLRFWLGVAFVAFWPADAFDRRDPHFHPRTASHFHPQTAFHLSA